MLGDQPGELKVVDRLSPFSLGQGDEFPRRGLVEAEVATERVLDVLALGQAELAVGMRQLDQQRTGGQLDSRGREGAPSAGGGMILWVTNARMLSSREWLAMVPSPTLAADDRHVTSGGWVVDFRDHDLEAALLQQSDASGRSVGAIEELHAEHQVGEFILASADREQERASGLEPVVHRLEDAGMIRPRNVEYAIPRDDAAEAAIRSEVQNVLSHQLGFGAFLRAQAQHLPGRVHAGEREAPVEQIASDRPTDPEAKVEDMGSARRKPRKKIDIRLLAEPAAGPVFGPAGSDQIVWCGHAEHLERWGENRAAFGLAAVGSQ